MIYDIIKKVRTGNALNKEDVLTLLSAQEGAETEALYEAARKTREERFGNRIYLYGFVYFSTWCRNNCNFCYYRRDNAIERYRKDRSEILDIATKLWKSGVIVLDLTMGEDMAYHNEDFKSIFEMIKEIKAITGLPIMISPGVVDHDHIDTFADLGVEWYALYQETHNRELYSRLRVGQDYDERMDAKLYAKSKGMLIEEGIMTGIGETFSDIADSLIFMSNLGAKQLRVMSFVPQKGIPMEHNGTPDRSLEHKIIAILRLMNPEVMIPASLDVDGIRGLKSRLDAGANVVTSIIPPLTGLAGVAQNSMDIDDGSRTVKGVTAILKEMGLVPGTLDEYKAAIEK
ncbi:MAG: methylornithine synthase PylB [Clostridiales bacterium]|mgnify:FL=1|nr:methylornithine synthase PylB [Clostridiales bacterium]